MVFSSLFFTFTFLPLVLLLYFIAKEPYRNYILLAASLLFYAYGEPAFVFVMIASIAVNYGLAVWIADQKQENRKRFAGCLLAAAVVANIGILFIFKYLDFAITSLNLFFHTNYQIKGIALPIGISFFTFQALSYVIDVYRGTVKVQKNPLYLALYISFFPQLIAGPIVRYSDVEKQLRKRTISWERFGEGSVWFLRGFGKKVLIANNIGSIYESIASLGISQTSALTAWIGCFAYTMQIYFDFGGYSDMAVGLGKMLGFDFMRNFDYPYISKSITEFWRRWHISLSSWFKEYVYIPLGGNRGGTLKAIRNLMVVWMLTGLWHGAAWNFIFWGLYYGIILCLEKYVLGDLLERLPQAARHAYTMILVMFGWVLFFSPSLGGAVSYLGAMFGIGGKGLVDMTGFYYLKSSLLLGIIAGIGSTPFVYRKFSELFWREERYMQIASVVMYAGIFLISTAYLVNDTYNPFLYFRF